jgi:hypothetical protein
MPVRSLSGVVTALALAISVTPSIAATPLFVSDSDVSGPSLIFRVDPVTGELTTIVSLSDTLGEVLGLAAANDNLLYAVAYYGDVMQITVNPPSVTTLGNLGPGFITGLAFSNGQLYAIDEGSDTLSTIQLSPLTQTLIGLVHVGSSDGPVLDIEGGDLAEDAGGNWFLWTNSTQALYRLDVTTAVATPVDAGASGLGTKTGIAFDYQGGNLLYASSRPLDTLFTLDPATGLPLTAVNFCLDCPLVYDYRFGDMASPRCTDTDGDGFSPEGSICGPVDCDDTNAAVHPGAPELCNNLDDDCNGTVDDEPAATAACPTDACTASVECVAGACVTTPTTCNDGNPCTLDTCDRTTGCVFTPVPDGESCADANLCNGSETCQGGICTSGPPLTCDDGNACTTDSCNPMTGCGHTPIPGCCNTDAECADQDACTVNERCVAHACTSSPRDCTDPNVCTVDSCNPASGCVHTPVVDGTSCSDGNPCNGTEQCGAGVCTSGAAPSCDDLDPCTADSCVDGVGCHHDPIAGCCHNDADCTDNDQCTVNEHCTAQHVCASSPLNCNDGNPCTIDACSAAAGCSHTPVSSGACDDGNPCTSGDTCTAGVCRGVPLQCSDGNLCNGQEVCIAEDGVCAPPGPPSLCTPGNRRQAGICAAEWFVDNPSNPRGALSTTQACTQGDPTCDHDADPTTCSFTVALCLHVPDPRLDPPCTPPGVLSFSLVRPTLARDPATAGALLAALDTLPGSTIGGSRQRDVVFSPAVDAVRCTPQTSIAVPVRHSLTVRSRAVVTGGAKMNATLRLKCLAH